MHESTFWTEWESRYPNQPSELAKDGAGNLYRESTPRILFVLKEPNKSPGADLRQDFLNSGAKWLIWHTIATWAAGTFNDFPVHERLYDSGGKVANENDALRRIAAINLKKLSGGASIDDCTLHRYSFRDRDLLREQIDDLDPTIILACGTFEPLLWLLDQRIPKAADLEKDRVIHLENGARLVRWRHPSGRTGAHYDELKGILG